MKADQSFISDIPLPSEDDPDLFDANCDPANPKTLTFDEVRLARERIKDGIIYTNCKDEAKRGVIACSAGNHALGLAYHGKLLNIPVTVIMPENASVMKRERCASFGGRVLLKGKNMLESKRYAMKMAKLNNLPLINGYDHPHILAGQGSVAIEILEQVPEVDAIIVPVGGGGLIAGISVAAKAIRPKCSIIAVESENCPGFNQAMLAGKPVYTENFPSCADGLAISMVGVNAFQTCRHLVDKVITLNESHIHRAVVRLLEVEKCVVECSAATSLAVIMADMLPELVGKKVVCLLSGGNIDTSMLGRVIERGLALEGRLCRFIVVIADQPGCIADLCALLKQIGVSIKDISQDRTWLKSSVFEVQVKCICETRDFVQASDLERALKAKYKHVVWGDESIW
ncbi:unnamed protein product [Trichobilharzia szidati]|nr:unnamed protein product [Trichobilharzia szidati]